MNTNEICKAAAGWDLLYRFSEVFARFGLTETFARDLAMRLPGGFDRGLFVGAGTGCMVLPFLTNCQRFDCVDYSRRMVQECVAKGLSCVQADARALPFVSRTFSLVVVSSGVLDCLDDDEALKVLRELVRVSKSRCHVLLCHLDHADDVHFYNAINAISQRRISTGAKIMAWKSRAILPNFQDRTAKLYGFFDRLAFLANLRGELLDEVLDALPYQHILRTSSDLASRAIEAGLRVAWESASAESRAFAVSCLCT